jgi:YggT family protein
VLTAAVFFRALLSWFPLDPHNPLVTILYEITEPILDPLRRVIPRLGMIDITPLVAIILIQVIGNVAANALR